MINQKTSLFGIIVLFLSIIIFNGTTINNSSLELNHWGYQLQNVDISQLASDPSFDLYVIDYSEDGSNDTAWNTQDIKLITDKGKLVVSYISIGEAEDYRYYWSNTWLDQPPIWLDKENPNWDGNFKVKYWYEGWQQLVFDYLDIIISQGFNGVYLDIIDAYEYYNDEVFNADILMLDLVSNISEYTRQRAGQDFLIIPQNGEKLLSNSNYRTIINGIGIEDLYFYSDNSPVDQKESENREELLKLLVDENKFVLTVDYVEQTKNRKFVYDRSISKGFIPYTTVPDLDELTPIFDPNMTNQANGFLIVPVVLIIGLKVILKKNKS